MGLTLGFVCSRLKAVVGVSGVLVLLSGCPQHDERDAAKNGSEATDGSAGDPETDPAIGNGTPTADAGSASEPDSSSAPDPDSGSAPNADDVDAAALGDASVPDAGTASRDSGPGVSGLPGNGTLAQDAGPAVDSGPPALEGWFVDSVHGNDANDGRSESTPFATLAKLLHSPLKSGDVTYLARGSLWREELVGLPAGSVVKAYGSGDRPIIDGSDIAANTSFHKTAELTNVYEIAWTHSFAADGGKSAHRVWEDGVRLRRAQDLASCDATPGSFYADAPTDGGPDTVYVHPSDGSDIPTNSHVYELSRRRSAVQLYQYRNHAFVYSVHTRRNAYADGSLVVDGLVSDCLAEDGRTHNVFIRGTCEDTTAWKIEPPAVFGAATMFVSFEDKQNLPNVTYRRCHAVADAEAIGPTGGRNSDLTIGFYGHTTGGAKFGTAVYEECSTSGAVLSFAFQNVTDALYYKCSSSGGSIVAGGTPDRTLAILGGTFHDMVDGATLLKINQDGGAPAKVIIRGVRYLEEGGHTMPIWINRGGGYIEITRSTFAQLGGGRFWFQKGNFVVKNNIFYGDNVVTQVYSSDVSYLADDNLYFNTNPDSPDVLMFKIDEGDLIFGLPAWKTAIGQDTNSLFADPLFVGDPRIGEFDVEPNSPSRAIAAGADYETEENDAVLQSYRAAMLSGAGI
jgi:hypothetical protein